MPVKKNHRLAIVVSIIICCFFSTLSVLAIINRQYIIDQIIVWQYKPSTEVTSLVERGGMGDYGKFLFYASEPALEATQKFNDACQRTETVVSILGCYKENKIYLYDIKAAELDGIRETTAVHETLHAAYSRLDDYEKKKVDNLLEIEYQKLEKIPEYKELMDYYAKSEPGQRDNELHSIIGTEIKTISSELETYYSKYFASRQKIVDLCTKYKAVFTALDKKAADLLSKMDSLSESIVADVDTYNEETITLNNDIASFNAKASGGGFSTQYQFNSARLVLVNRLSTLESERFAIEEDMKLYRSYVDEYNTISTQSTKLTNSIDSTLAPAPSV